MKMTLSRLRYRASLNKLGYEELSNGNTIDVNTEIFSFWFGYYKQSLSQSVSSNAFDYLKDKVTIVTKHNNSFVEAMDDQNYTITLPAPNTKTYNVASINPDYEVNGYDTIVLSLVGESSDTTSDSDSSTTSDSGFNSNGLS